MGDNYWSEQAYYLIAKHSGNYYHKVQNIYREICEDIDKNGLDNKYGLCTLEEAIMSASKYYAISQLITFPEKTVVVDCGCNAGIQQVFFQNCYKYIGIDMHDTMVEICDNIEYIQGDIVEVLPKMQFEKDKTYFGISVLCGMCFENVNNAMKQKFNELVIV